MNKRVKKLWLAALRSGKFRQARKRLRRGGKRKSFCCLGVLCEVYHSETGKGRWKQDGRIWFFYPNGSDPASEILPPKVREWAGLDTSNPSIGRHGDREGTLAAAINDRGKDFEFIADRIEEYL